MLCKYLPTKIVKKPVILSEILVAKETIMRMQMTMTKRWAAVAVLAILMIAGCNKSRETQLVGKWKADASAMTPPTANANDPQAKAMAEMMKGMMSGMSLDLKADKTFDMNMMMAFSGTWAIDEAANTVALTMTKMANMDISKMPNANANAKKPMLLQIAPDNSRLTMQPPAGQPATASPMGGLAFVKE